MFPLLLTALAAPSLEYADIATISVVESAANTLTFKKLDTNVSSREKVAMLIHRVELYSNGFALLVAADDTVDVALCGSQVADLEDLTNPQVYWHQKLFYGDVESRPIRSDLTSLPGGGLLILPNPLYLGAKGASIASASTEKVRLYYTLVELKDDQFWQLAQSLRILAS
jgi:hypothetical protein